MKQKMLNYLINESPWCGRDEEIIETFINSFFKTYQPERSKREDFRSYDSYNLDCGCHEEKEIFSLHDKCNNLDHINRF